MTQSPPPPDRRPAGSPTTLTESQLRWRFAGGWPAVIVVGLMFVFAGVFAAVLASDLHADYRYRTAGATADDGAVVGYRYEVRKGSRNRRSTSFHLQYRFTDPAGTVRFADESVPREVYDRYAGDRKDAERTTFLPLLPPVHHPVQYLSDDPAESRLLRDRSNAGKWAMAAVAVVLAVLAAGIRYASTKRARRRARVVFHGTPVPGQILVSETRGHGKSKRNVIQYRYVGPDGVERTSPPQNVRKAQLAEFPVGTIVTVLVDPADPERPEADLLGIRASAS